MKKQLLLALLALGTISLSGCADKGKTITIAASEIPHAKILKEAVAPVLKDKGFTLEVTVLDWTQQNSAVARGEYDANYFQHMPYLNTYNADAGEEGKLTMVCKAHFEKLCLYASNLNHKTLADGDRIEIVNDVSNIERALLLLKSHGVLSAISDSCYDGEGNFTFDVTSPNSQVTFAPEYAHCSLHCLSESVLATSLADYDFGVLPGNTALLGLGEDYAQRIVFGETIDADTLSLRANGVAVKPSEKDSEKTKALVEAFGSQSVADYISTTFGESVVYHFENLL